MTETSEEQLARVVREKHGQLFPCPRVAAGFARVRCAAEHVFEDRITRILGGAWCPACARSKVKPADLRAAAERHGGECLELAYRGFRANLEWRCAHGHTFRMRLRSVLDGVWCPECAGPPRPKRTVYESAELHRIAREHGGRVVSALPVKIVSAPSWECAEGHRFRASPQIAAERWCTRCASSPRAPEFKANPRSRSRFSSQTRDVTQKGEEKR